MTSGEALSLRMTRTLPARRAVVWSAMTDPEELANWWGPSGFTTPSVDFEPRLGESYRIAMQPPDGDVFRLGGEFREVDPPSRLAYTFSWDPPDPHDRETVVMLSLRELGDQTEVELSQGEFATKARLELHEGGWTDSFDKLEELLG
ncbi:MAG TPA: SRPBCC domain-containing protein [Solirubrobacterales bacterium]